MSVPDVLINGNHQEIRRWRREQALKKTLRNRPDLLEGMELSKEDDKILNQLKGRPEGANPDDRWRTHRAQRWFKPETRSTAICSKKLESLEG